MRPTRWMLATMTLALVASCTTSTRSSSSTPEETAPLLRDGDTLAAAMDAIEDAVGADPAQVREVDVYPTYVIVEAQDPRQPDHLDRYTWRDDEVEAPEPVHLSGPQEAVDAALFPTSIVRWAELPNLLRRAERRTARAEPIRIEEPDATYVNVARSGTEDAQVRIQIQISGPRRSGFVIATADGRILEVAVG